MSDGARQLNTKPLPAVAPDPPFPRFHLSFLPTWMESLPWEETEVASWSMRRASLMLTENNSEFSEMWGVFAVGLICEAVICVDVLRDNMQQTVTLIRESLLWWAFCEAQNHRPIHPSHKNNRQTVQSGLSMYLACISVPVHNFCLGRLLFRNLQIPGETETSSFSVSFWWDLLLFLHSLCCLQQQVSVQPEKQPCGRSQWHLCCSFGHRPASAALLIVWRRDTLPCFPLSQIESRAPVPSAPQCSADPPLVFFFLLLPFSRLQWSDAWVWCSRGRRWWSWKQGPKDWWDSSTWMSIAPAFAGSPHARARRPRVSLHTHARNPCRHYAHWISCVLNR